ncbi:MAG TPA: TRAP transporter small permease subunit [Rudaea sp.]|nr:TRAP transporter small permease subunit [Rudaea sp.]
MAPRGGAVTVTAEVEMTAMASKRAEKILHHLHRVEDWLLALLVLVLVGLAGTQIVLRVFFETGLAWSDSFSRTLVLWTGMLGALAAVRDDRHIALDLLQRYLSPRVQHVARFVTLGFAALLCASMAWYSTALVAIDYAEGLQGSGGSIVAALRACQAESILPVAFGLMALRFALRAFAAPARAPMLLHDPGEAPR